MTDRLSSDELEGLRVSEAIRQGVLAERDELRAANAVLQLRGDTYLEQLQQKHAENERLRAALVQIENWVGKLPSNMGEAALIFEYIEQACAVLDRTQHPS